MCFFANVDKTFKDQSKENDFQKQDGHYIDKTFNFELDNVNINSNCLLSSSNEKNFSFLKELKIDEWIKNIENNNYEFYNEYGNVIINDNKLDFAFNELINDPYIKNKIQSKNDWKMNWKNIFKNSNTKGKKKIFDKLYINNIKKLYNVNSPNRYIKEFSKLFEYRRISLNNLNYKIFEDKIDCTNVEQGSLGTCYLLEAISTLSNYGQLLFQLFPNENLNNEGLYEICLFYKGEWQKVLIDDYFFFYKNVNNPNNEEKNFAFVRPIRGCLFTCLLEKAYAKLNGSYADINGGFVFQAFEALTGFESIVIKNKDINKEVFEYSYNKLRDGYLFACCTLGHAYSILDITRPGPMQIIKVRNPWNKLMKEENELYQNFINNYYPDYNNKNNLTTGIFSINKNEFKQYFEGGMTICQILFGSTICSYNLNNIINNMGYFYLYFEIFTQSKISMGIYDKDNKLCSDIFSVKIKNLTKNIEKNMNAIRGIINEINMNRSDLVNYNFDIYDNLEASKYLLKIDFSRMEIFGRQLKVILKGNVKMKYLGCHAVEPNTNYIKEFPIDYKSYTYGLKTSELFEKYKKIMSILEKELGIKMNLDSKGYYLETLITNEVETVITIDKQKLNKKICSHDTMKDLYFVGENHQDGKINGMGKLIKIDNDINEVYFGKIVNNKIESYQLDINKNSDKAILKIKNVINSVKSYLHEHELIYKSVPGDWICDFCNNYFNKSEESFGCRKCDYDLCLNCLSSDFKQSMLHKHPLEFKEIAYQSKGFICDICENSYYSTKSFHCNSCQFDLCLNCSKIQWKIEQAIYSKINSSMCQIIIGNNSNIYYGFFIKIYSFIFLITDKNSLSMNSLIEDITIRLNNNIFHLIFNIKRKIFEEINYFTCIEITQQDSFYNYINPFEVYQNNQNYYIQSICIPYFESNQLKMEIGLMNPINNNSTNFFIYNCNINSKFFSDYYT